MVVDVVLNTLHQALLMIKIYLFLAAKILKSTFLRLEVFFLAGLIYNNLHDRVDGVG